MGFLDFIFGKNKNIKMITCPRCLGKGFVDENDIKRLKKELIWIPGDCAYCNKLGKVDSKLETKIPVDESYLVTNLDTEERERLINNDSEAKKRAKEFDRNVKEIINQIRILYHDHKLGVTQIADHFLSNSENNPESDEYAKEKVELISYIKRVIESNFPKN